MGVKTIHSQRGASTIEYTMLCAIFALGLIGSIDSFGAQAARYQNGQTASFLGALAGNGSPSAWGRLPFDGGSRTSTVRPKSSGVDINPSAQTGPTPPKDDTIIEKSE